VPKWGLASIFPSSHSFNLVSATYFFLLSFEAGILVLSLLVEDFVNLKQSSFRAFLLTRRIRRMVLPKTNESKFSTTDSETNSAYNRFRNQFSMEIVTGVRIIYTPSVS
jgi:AAA15 family ATPase/GTPase